MKKSDQINLNKTFKNKTVLVTGHTGFKGSWLSLWLVSLGAKVIGVSIDVPSKPSHFKLIKLEKKMKSIYCDISNFKKFKKIINKSNPDFIFHLAAQAIVKKSYEDPYKTWKTNLIGTLNLLEILRKYKKKSLISIFITSDKVYKNIETKIPYQENDELGGLDPYSGSKSSADVAIQSYVASFMKNNSQKSLISIARAGNVIGGGDWSYGRLIPDCVRAWSKNKEVIIRNPKSTRPWQHVLEVIAGYLQLAAKLKKNKRINGQAFNFGPKLKDKFRVIDVLKESKIIWDKAKWKKDTSKYFSESNLLHLNSSKANKVLGWKHLISFNDTINLTINWYKKFYEKNINIEKISLEQIKLYQNKMRKN